MVRSPQDARRLEFGRPALHPFEFALVTLTILHLGFLPWALGTMHAWSQLTSLGFSLAGFILAAIPRPAMPLNDEQASRSHPPLIRLIGSPVFFAALLLVVYLLIQALNPAWRFFVDADHWWLESVKSISWLPSSVDAPFARSNTWRTLVVVCSLISLTGSVWLGFTRRRSYHTLFFALAANAGLLALVGFAQRLSGTGRIFGLYPSSNYSFVASFIYPNHGGGYFNLMTALSVGLAWWHYSRYRQGNESPGPAIIALWLAMLCAGIVALSYSRMSIVLLVTFILITGIVMFVRLTRQRGPLMHRPEVAPLSMLLFTLVGIGAAVFGSETIRERFAKISTNPVMAVQDRTLAREAAGELFRDHWAKGWGAGCFRYVFPKYTEKYPAIHYLANGNERVWEHAHNDILETLDEIGVLGILPIVFILGWVARALWRKGRAMNAIPIVLTTMCLLTLIHSWVDFVFQNPAILLTWSVLLIGILRWADLERAGATQKSTAFLSRETGYTRARGVSSPA